jgi:cytochrome c554/c'-like protein
MRRTEGIVALALLALTLPVAAADPIPPPGGPSAAERDFIARHWRGAIPPQGPAPARFSPIERSLQPEACGACHPVQFSDWQASLHSKSMGPGIAGQLLEMAQREPAAARSCARCHAPVAEQRPELNEAGQLVPNRNFDPGLQARGIICASCHVRGHEHFGPPRRDGSMANRAPREQLPHGGVTRTAAFLHAEFCASCHQFGTGGLALNGKPLENTYAEWRQSPAARRGLHCQNCHMPDRRHLWRGIHDAEMVRSGLAITLRADKARYRMDDRVQATLVIATPGVGHAFPTYVTPQVRVRAELVDASGQSVAGTVEERVIARQVPLDLSREFADTRIPPGGRFTLAYARPLGAPGLRLRVTVTVLPDEFYTRFFETLLSAGAGAGEEQIREALEATRRSPYTLYVKDLPLT